MIFARRDRRGPGRFLTARLALLFLGASVWVGGLVTQRTVLTGAAIVILLVALVLGILDRREGPRPE